MKFQYESTAFRPRFQNCVTTSRSEYHHHLYHLCEIIFKKKAWTKAISLVFKKEKKRKEKGKRGWTAAVDFPHNGTFGRMHSLFPWALIA